MRPKKRVLVYCEDVDRLGTMTFLLLTYGYDVFGCDTEPAMVELLMHNYDTILLVESGSPLEDLTYRTKHLAPEIPVLLQIPKQRMVQSVADGVVSESLGPAVLLEALRMRLARKRGPKKRYVFIEEQLVRAVA